ncbi:MAG: hypothetical protein AAF921_27540 [Cyanobacteria bacterium P01_D01_bin.44]
MESSSDRTPQAPRTAMLASLETYADPAIWSKRSRFFWLILDLRFGPCPHGFS